jgi:hypothetical protein
MTSPCTWAECVCSCALWICYVVLYPVVCGSVWGPGRLCVVVERVLAVLVDGVVLGAVAQCVA